MPTIKTKHSNTLVRLIEDGLFVSIGFFVVLFAIYAINQPSALQPSQFKSAVINASLALALAAAGLALVVLIGGLDLSSAGIIAFTNAILTTYYGGGVGQQLILLVVAVLVGIAAGAINGIIVHKFDLEPVVVTLATGFVMSGFALLVLPKPAGLQETDGASLISMVTADVFQIPVGLLILFCVAVGWIFLRRSRLGSGLISVGSDKEAAASTGIGVGKTTIFAFAAAGGLYGLAGVAVTSQTSGGDPQLGAGYMLGTFAAVVIGGMRLGGGRGSVIGAIMGAMAVTISINVIFVLGFATFWTNIVQGVLLLAAIGAQAVALILIRRYRRNARSVQIVGSEA